MVAAWRAVLRMAWREVWRAKGQSMLIMALIGLPVLALCAGDVVYRTYQLTPLQRYERANGAASAELSWGGGGRVQQAPSGGYNYDTTGRAIGVPRGGGAESPGLAAVTRALGPGAHVIARTLATGTVVTKAGLAAVDFVGVDYAGPVGAGLARQLQGRAPRHGHDVDVTTELARQTGLHIGSTLRTLYPTEAYRVVGMVADPSRVSVSEAFFMPSAVSVSSRPGSPLTDFLAQTVRPVTWAVVKRLNAYGYVVDSREVTQNPPPVSDDRFRAGNSTPDRTLVVSGTLVVGLALLEIILLAGPAFAVMARRQERSLALMAAAGATRRDLRNVVLAYGIVLGAVGGVVAVGLGVIVARLSLPLIAHIDAKRPDSFTVRPAELIGITLLSLVTAVGAAVMPARAAGGIDVVAALSGRRPRRPARMRVPVLAMVVAGLGVLVALGGAGRRDISLIVAGVAIMELGLVVATPTILLLVTGIGRWLPLAPRLALRDAGRNRSSAAPAVAAVMAAVIGCVAALVGVTTQAAADRTTYVPSAAHGDVIVQPDPGTSAAVVAAMRSTLPARSVQVISQLGCDVQCATVQIAPRVPSGRSRVTRVLQGGSSSDGLVAGPSGETALTGNSSPAVDAALRAGKAIVPDSWSVTGGRATLDVITYPLRGGRRVRQVTVPAIALTTGLALAAVIVPPSLVARFGTGSSVTEVLAADRTMPTTAQLQALAAALAKIVIGHPLARDGDAQGPTPYYVERGYQDPLRTRMLLLVLAASLVAIAAAGIATGLSNSDRREDFLTLDAVGAGSTTRRVVSAARGAVIAGIGALVGTVAGFVPVVAYIVADNRGGRTASTIQDAGSGTPGTLLVHVPSDRLHLAVPWGDLALVVVGIPLAAALLAGVLSRSRLPVNRRALIARFG
jgi:putative ABC transport system permease protein